MPFVKGVEPFLKGDGQLVKGADRLKLLSKLAVFPLLLIIDEFLSGFRDKFSKKEKFPKRVTRVAFAIKFAKTNLKIAEISEICENYSIFFNIFQYYSIVSLVSKPIL